jgi:flagellar motor switch protein FliN/FliY
VTTDSTPTPAAELTHVQLPSLEDAAAPGAGPAVPPQLAAFGGVKTTVKVIAGEAQSTLGDLLALKEGAVLALDRAVDAPFDIVLEGVVLARGQLVAVGEQFGIRITEVRLPQQA